MKTIPLTLTDSELAAYREGRLEFLVRLAEKCGPCEGSGYVLSDSRSFDPCLACNGTGYRNPLGESGDVLFHQEEWGVPLTVKEDEPYKHPEVSTAYVNYKAGGYVGGNHGVGGAVHSWRPADSMPEWASRIHLPRTDDPRLVRLWDVTAKECIQAGGPDDMSWCYGPACPGGDDGCNAKGCLGVREAYSKIWDANNPGAPWSSNPVVVVGGVK